MNTGVLKKCIEELGKDAPDLSYIRGMLETLVELSASPQVNNVTYRPQATAINTSENAVADETNPTLNAYLGGNTGAIT